MLKFKESIELLNNAKSVGIFTHANVDGDAIGSAFAIYYYLKDRGVEAEVIADTTIPNQLKFLKVDKLIKKTEAYNLLNIDNEDYFIGGKTGSSQDGRDAWFIGFANDLTIGIWFGNDDNTSTNLMGGNLPAMLWKDIVEGMM